ncbi:DNA mismatch repair endonuclease MutL [Thermodesulfobacteriota bacterium]
MSQIRILPEKVASQIAAGEVIERPASVVRELVDNSIDAGADRISILIEKGGKRRIKVSDNGTGMNRDDLLLCVERHATSKIESASDLFCIKSLGFRGEALPSIAAVAKIEITTRLSTEISGHRLRVEGGKFLKIEETGCPQGTVIDVRSLFFNVPARKKFLRADRTETGHISENILKMALPYKNISFRLDDAARNVVNLPASSQLLPRISSIMGRRVAESMVEVEEENAELSLKAYLAHGELSRGRGDRLLVYINGRNVRDRMVNKAILESYGQRLMKGRYPQAVVMLNIEPDKVDVNVHPAKHEVRFLNTNKVYETIISAVGKALKPKAQVFMDSPGDLTDYSDVQQSFQHKVLETALPYGMDEHKWEISEAETPEDKGVPEKGVKIIGQLRNTYILCELQDGFLILDQHAAHERIVFETLKRGILESGIESQTLLIPYELEFTLKERDIFFEKGDQLGRFGIEIEHFGGNTFLLRAVPVLLENVHWDSFFSEVLLRIGEENPSAEADIDGILSIMACHGAIRAGQRLMREEMEHLVRQIQEMELPTNCPHGRPIFKFFRFYEIEKMFKRVL